MSPALRLQFMPAVASVLWQGERIFDLWLFDQARSNHADGDSTTNDLPVFNNPNLLQIAFELPSRHASRLPSVSAEVLWFTALSDIISSGRLQITVEFKLLCSLDSLILLECTHCLNSFLTDTYYVSQQRSRLRAESLTAAEATQDTENPPLFQFSFERSQSTIAGQSAISPVDGARFAILFLYSPSVERHSMRAIPLLMSAILVTATCSGQDERSATLRPDRADADFALQGEYTGKINSENGEVHLGLQIIASGGGKFRSVAYVGGLPGDGWSGSDETKFLGSGESSDGVLEIRGDNGTGRATIKDGTATVYSSSDALLGILKKVTRKSPTLGKKAPAEAVVLFDGSTAEHFIGGRLSGDGLLKQGATSKQQFGSYKLHMEFLLSYMPYARGQGRANSGCYHQGRYEVQILDSFGLKGENNECGGIYTIAPPKINMCFPPLSWQTYDVEFHEAIYDDAGRKTQDAWITVMHNGVKVHDHQELAYATRAHPVDEGPEDGPIYLQDHNNPIRFRNIWVLPIE